MIVTHHYLYYTWCHMKERCYNETSPDYKNYGGRGITICEEWLNSETFLLYCDNVLGPRPEGYSIDRIDNQLGYAPGNVRWADKHTQNINRRHYTHSNNKVGVSGYKWVFPNGDKYAGKFHYKRKAYLTPTRDTPLQCYEDVLELRKQMGIIQ